jgi:hypothetical protein
VHTVEFSRIGCSGGFAFLLGFRATSLTYLLVSNLSNRHARKLFEEVQSKHTCKNHASGSLEEFDWPHLSRANLFGFPPQLWATGKTLRFGNGDVKSLWQMTLLARNDADIRGV